MSDWQDNNFEFEKEVDIDVETEIEFEVEVELKKEVNIKVETNVKTDIEGNTAILVADVEAIGKDSFVEVFTSVLAVEDTMSSVTIEASAAVA